MASQSDNEHKNSTLQLFIHDQGGNAPERNGETAAIELDFTATTPQVAFHTAPEARYSSCLPEVMDSLGCENKEESAPKSAYNRRLSKIMLFTILALFVAVAIGTGVGVGLTRKKYSISNAQHEEFPSYHGSILPGSSLALIAPPNGDRRLFFQNRKGEIIQALFQPSVNKWNTQIVVASDARNNTPISATFSWGNPRFLYLFYIDDIDQVTMKFFTIGNGAWQHGSVSLTDPRDKDYNFTMDALFTVTNANASSLSATSILGPGNKTDITLLFENLNGDIVMIRGTPDLSAYIYKWYDISPKLRSAAPDALLRPPFTGGSIMAGRSEIIVTEARIRPSQYVGSTDRLISIIAYQNETFTSNKTVGWDGTGRHLPNANNGRTFLLSVDQPGGRIEFKNLDLSNASFYTSLSGQFPFSKAAALFNDQSGAFIVYHQTENLSIAEEMWDSNIGGWINGTWIDYNDNGKYLPTTTKITRLRIVPTVLPTTTNV